MSNPPKIFYSWQSDLPNSTNRTFIEKCIKAALKRISQDSELLPRPEIDKDTHGVPGSPSIIDTIFRKISDSHAFIADLSFISGDQMGKPTPNPNVLIEYGWALKSLGNEKIIAVMNEAYGKATEISVPFNIRGFRWPRTYRMSEDMSAEEKSKEKEALTKHFEEQIRAMLKLTPLEKFVPATAQSNDPSLFCPMDEPLGHGYWPPGNEEFEFYLVEHPRLFLRLFPTVHIGNISSKRAEDLLKVSELSPMGLGLNPKVPKGHEPAKMVNRNRFGAIVSNQLRSNFIGARNLSQLFESGELWGVDTYAIAEERSRQRGFKNWQGEIPDEEMMFPDEVEATFCKTLCDFVDFSIHFLNSSFPMEVKLGASQIQDYKVAVSVNSVYKEVDLKGRAVKDSIEISGRIDSEESISSALEGLLQQFWEELGLTRDEITGLPTPLRLNA